MKIVVDYNTYAWLIGLQVIYIFRRAIMGLL